jgi:hypothetical protein
VKSEECGFQETAHRSATALSHKNRAGKGEEMSELQFPEFGRRRRSLLPRPSDPAAIACVLLLFVAMLGAVKASLMLEPESPFWSASTNAWIDARGQAAIEQASEKTTEFEQFVGALILLGIASDAQERGASAELAVLEVAMPILEQVAIDGGGSVRPAGREAVWACAVLTATPWWCFPLAGIPLLIYAGNPARGGYRPFLWAVVGVAAAMALRQLCVGP